MIQNLVIQEVKADLLVTVGEDGTAKLWQIGELDDLVELGCNWVRDYYLKNLKANLSESDRHLCDDAPKPVISPTTPPLTANVFLPSRQAIAEDYYTRGSEQADREYIQNFGKILANSFTKAQKADAYINRGVIYYRQKKYTLAIKDYEEALKLIHNNTAAYINKGMAYSSLQEPKHQQAIDDYNEAISLDSKNTDAYINRGIAYSGLGKHEAAIKDYDQAIAITPNNADAYYAKAFTQTLIEGKKQEAINNYRQAAKFYQQQNKPNYSNNALNKIKELSISESL